MTQIIVKRNYEPIIQMVEDAVSSPETKRKYRMALRDFFIWYTDRGRPPLVKAVVQEYTAHLENSGLGGSSINLRLSAIRKMAQEAMDNLLLDYQVGLGILNSKGIRQEGQRTGNWLTKREAQKLLRSPSVDTLVGLRDRALLAVFLGCGLRRSEVASLEVSDIQQRDGRWVIVDIVGKRNKMRSVPAPSWCKMAIDEWLECAGIVDGKVFRPVHKGGYVDGDSMTSTAIFKRVKRYTDISPHDLRRTFAKLADKGGADLVQIQKSLGHSSVQITESYVGADQDLVSAPCDVLGLSLL